ncbi:SHOCT domain-containing protein [Rubrobacter taiwanensis]|jgi:putative membrane protein|uniref:SHOCT domain-containing protein n=1 Tax=Rubrobacter taiwanensis TaxID=185139 RepID=A0A4V2NWD6_9ACTN|nr:SHOCT domain-containing protein [Rubrobacter taiwanensis]TCJ16852.1 SHOCT domain-containing protein [Rubrobacter taiwanensis]
MSDAAKVALGVIGGALAVLLVFALFGGTGGMMGGFGGPGGMMGGGGFGAGWMLVPLLFWGGLLVLIAWAVARIFPGGRSAAGRRDSAEEILRERFARGEMEREEYERAREALREEADREARAR